MTRPLTSFLNPYHFMPLPDKWDVVKSGYLERDKAKAVLKDHAVAAEGAHLRHDQFGTNLLSGRILCRLTTVSPCVFGNRHEPCGKWSAKVHNYEIDGNPAVASTQLRGLISTIAEAASGSGMRVLVNRGLSYRSDPRRQPRAAIGLVVGERGHRRILPLTFPRLQRGTRLAKEVFSLFKGEAPEPWHALLKKLADGNTGQVALSLGVYLDGYDTGTNKKGNRTPHALDRPHGVLQKLFKGRPLGSSCHANHLTLWKLKAPRVTFKLGETNDGPAVVPLCGGVELTPNEADQLIHRARAGQSPYPVTLEVTPGEIETSLALVEQGEDLQSLINQGWRIGVVRRLRKPRKKDDDLKVLGDKKHELFIPIEHHLDLQARVPTLLKNGDRHLDAESVCLAFENNANTLRELHKDERPFRLMGQPLGRVVLREGDLVHFRLEKELVDSYPAIESVAISSIWREDAGSLFDYFQKLGLEELMPFTKDRVFLSPADQLFGFVEQGGPSSQTDETGRGELTAYASRVRFSAARLHESAQPPVGGFYLNQGRIRGEKEQGSADGWFPLKILSSPKPPCPEFYFESPTGKRLARPDLKPANPHATPQGWKFYLHDPDAMKMTKRSSSYRGASRQIYTWETQNAEGRSARENQKMLVQPVAPGVEFYFHLDFFNLKMDELGVLRYSLQPYADFHHKLGLAKPLGLGTVKIEPLGLFIVKRGKRYRESTALLARAGRSEARYHLVATNIPSEQRDACCARLPARYHREAEALRKARAGAEPGEASWDTDLGFRPLEKVRAALELLGDPDRTEKLQARLKTENTDLLVHYPYTGDPEDELFEWHKTHRDHPTGSYLKPLARASDLIDVVLKQDPRDPEPATLLDPPGGQNAAE
jgi:hypothetical protein